MKRFFCLLFLVRAFCAADAQLPEFSFRHYTNENDLPVPSIEQMVQDKDGFIWCEGSAVVSRYDGNPFHIYSHDEKDSFSLPLARAFRFGKGNKNKVIIACEKGVYYYDGAINGFRMLCPGQSFISSPTCAPFSRDNDTWFAAKDKALHCFNSSTGQVRHFAACKSSITSVLIDSFHRVWVGTVAGLYRFFPEKNSYEQYWQDTANAMYGAALVSDIIEDKQGHIWFSGYNSGIYSLDPSKRLIHFFDFKPVHWRNGTFYILSQLEQYTANGRQYIMAKSDDGLAFLDPESGNYTLIKHEAGNSYSLLSENLRSVFYDNTGTLWVSVAEGLSKSERRTFDCKTVHLALLGKKRIMQPDDEKNTEINVVYEDHRHHTTWLGTDNLGLLEYNPVNDSIIRQIALPKVRGNLPAISQLHTDKSGRLWLGTSEGVFIYESRAGAPYPLAAKNTATDPLAAVDVTASFFEDGQHNMWIGRSKGISIYDDQLHFIKSLTPEEGKAGALQGQFVFAIYPKNNHQVWVSTRVLNLYDTDSACFVGNIIRNKKAYWPGFVTGITGNRKGDFYFLGSDGVYVLTEKADSFDFPAYNISLAAKGRGFQQIFSDNNEQLWVTTLAAGLVKINPALNETNRFTRRNGLARNELDENSQASAGDQIFMITRDGFQYFNPDSIRTDSFRAPLRITGINVMDKPLKMDYQSPGSKELKISYRENIISFEFSLLDYSYNEDATYQYKLDGFDKNWVNAGRRRAATYTNLDPGSYIFRVRARNHDNVDCGETVIALKITPPLWKTGWFITLAALVVLFSLYRGYAYLRQKYLSEKIINSFTSSLYAQSTIEDMAWDIADNCIDKLGFVDCVVYIMDDEKNILLQKAARGPKNPARREILNPIEIPYGKGIVGAVARSGVAEIIPDTSRDKRYIVDEMQRLSEIAVPMVADGQVLGVIDSEHPKRNFYTRQHLYLLTAIAAVCSVRINKYLLEEKLRNRIARDLHDDIGSTLSSININSKMALGQVGEESVVKGQLEKIRRNSGNMMESMSDIIWAISPANDSIESLIIKMKEFAAEILEAAGISYSFKETGDYKKSKLNVNKRKEVYLIYKEALNNAAKYSLCRHVTISIDFNGHELALQVSDDGRGFEMTEIKPGNGLRNIRERAAAMGGRVDIKAEKNKGVSVVAHIPLT